MGAKAALLAFAPALPRDVLVGYPPPDAARSRALVETAFPHRPITVQTETNLDVAVHPPVGTACAGVYGDVRILTGRDLAARRPSELTALIRRLGPAQQACAVFMESTIDWYAFAVWDRGALLRSFSASAADGVVEDIGSPLAFEAPGATTIERANEALRTYLGFVQEGRWERDGVDPEDLRLAMFTFADAEAERDAIRAVAARMVREQPQR